MLYVVIILLFFLDCKHRKITPSFKVKNIHNSEILNILESSDRVLWIGAHPDDENSSIGLLAMAKEITGSLYLASLTHGENSHIVWDGLCRGSQIARSRTLLFSEAASILRADGYYIGPFVNGPHTLWYLDSLCPPGAPFIGWPDTTDPDDVISKWNGEGDPIRFIVWLIRRLKPDVIITMDSACGVSGNPEHLATTRLIMNAIEVAKNPDMYPYEGPPWKVKYVIFTTYVIPELVSCGYCKCISEPSKTDEEIYTLNTSGFYGDSYFYVGCLVKMNYANTMNGLGWSDAMIRGFCQQQEEKARNNPKKPGYPVYEPYAILKF